ncbi:acyl- --sterol O-acyltransferase 1-like [Olea europaea subsp. europaea]|uniref:Acyl- --sterol O-acyltransferase 1-like n=1 Tax=Olea europaea subsp. europaea TaxID=158383 RepID=A0A8S0PYJ1_OLEEU|nr:acyl- --sterol O-acyltransferase 1-like [Olea europaea subsp. europaea]
METEGGTDIKKVLSYWMEGEINNFIKVWLSVYVSLSYCYLIAKIIPKGSRRLLAFIPVVFLFLFLPLKLHTIHLGGLSAFFIAWLANFKILMFAFNEGPLSDPSLSLPRFLAIACLPIKLQSSQNLNKNQLSQTEKGHKSVFNYAVKGFLLALFIKFYDYSDYIHPTIMLVIYSFHIYFCLEIALAIAAAMARALLGAELEPQFNEPYLSTSLQDFWGRRWNLMVTRILRPTVYMPVLSWSTSILGRKWAPLPAVISTFFVSGLIHELIFYYLGRVKPTWEITCFFLLHGVCLSVEIAVKKSVKGRIHIPRIIASISTVGFAMTTIFWLFFPPLLRCKADERAFAEYAAVGAFAKDFFRALA